MIAIHENTNKYVYKISREVLYLKCLIEKDKVKEVSLEYFDRGTTKTYSIPMTNKYQDSTLEYYFCSLEKDIPLSYIKYYFKLITHTDEILYLGQHGLVKEVPSYPFEFLYLNQGDVHTQNNWLKDCIFYQIFPERFANGDKGNDPEKTIPWGEKPTEENFMGGDLQGVIDKIPYLKDLGINCIYLTPIFKAMFNHKYATTDYYTIDENFGTKETFKNLVDECHRSGIKIILDGVFNHSGVDFFAFKDVLENQENSKYIDWFYIKKFPVLISDDCYESVGGYKWMPKLNTSNNIVQDYFINVLTYWIEKYHIDGWRLDVCDEMDKLFVMKAKKHVETIKNDVPFIGETWGYPGDMLTSSHVNSIMNYVFRDNLIEYIAKNKIDNSEFINRSEKMYGSITDVFNDGLYNLLDSHDTERFMTLCENDVQKYMRAVTLQFILKGSPAVYYGDELGMNGFNDPDCRKAMDWEQVNEENELLIFFKKMIRLRKKYKCLRRGEISFYDDNGILLIEREYQDTKISLLYNNTSNPVRSNRYFGELIHSSVNQELESTEFQPQEIKIFVYQKEDIK